MHRQKLINTPHRSQYRSLGEQQVREEVLLEAERKLQAKGIFGFSTLLKRIVVEFQL